MACRCWRCCRQRRESSTATDASRIELHVESCISGVLLFDVDAAGDVVRAGKAGLSCGGTDGGGVGERAVGERESAGPSIDDHAFNDYAGEAGAVEERAVRAADAEERA